MCQRRKDGKFNCKVCGAKQSIRAILARSENASQLRPVVQKINYARGNAGIDFENVIESEGIRPSMENGNIEAPKNGNIEASEKSRWALLSQHNGEGESRESQFTCEEESSGDDQFVTTLPEFQKGKRNKRKRFTRDTSNPPTPHSYSSRKQLESTKNYDNSPLPEGTEVTTCLTPRDEDQERADVTLEGYAAMCNSSEKPESPNNETGRESTGEGWGNSWGEAERSVWD